MKKSMRANKKKDVQEASLSWPGKAYLAVVLLVILPFIILSFYNHPQNDDYIFAAQTKAIGAIKTNIFWYNSWSPRYFAVAAATLNPIVYDSFFGYKLGVAVTIILLFAALSFFIRELFRKDLTVRQILVLALSLIAIYLLRLPIPSQSLYWLNAAAGYQFNNILLLLMLGMLTRCFTETGPGTNTLVSAVVVVLIVAVAGTNELTMLMQTGILLLLVAIHAFRYRTMHPAWLLFLIVAIVCATIVLLSPGMIARHGSSKHDFWQAGMMSLAMGCRFGASWLFLTPLLPVTFLLLRSLETRSRPLLRFSLHPAILLVLSVAAYFALFFPAAYSTGVVAERAVSVMYFFFLIAFFLNVCNVIDHVYFRRERMLPRPSRSAVTTAAVLAFLLLVLPGSNMKDAYADLWTGAAASYDRELNERYLMIRYCPQYVCDVPPLSRVPKTLYFFENALDEAADGGFFTSYKERGYAAYFGKMRVRLSAPPAYPLSIDPMLKR